MDYVIEHLKETTCLHKFRCGVPAMDRFIQDGLNLSIDNHYCEAYIVKDIRANNIIALFALSFDSLDLDIDDKTDMMSGLSTTDTPLLTDNYKDVFLNKSRYPALEIAYLAVSESYGHNKGLGSSIIEAIIDRTQQQDFAGCQFVTVEALNTKEHNAVGFYIKCGFSPCEFPDPNKGTLRMFRTLYPLPLENDVY